MTYQWKIYILHCMESIDTYKRKTVDTCNSLNSLIGNLLSCRLFGLIPQITTRYHYLTKPKIRSSSKKAFIRNIWRITLAPGRQTRNITSQSLELNIFTKFQILDIANNCFVTKSHFIHRKCSFVNFINNFQIIANNLTILDIWISIYMMKTFRT